MKNTAILGSLLAAGCLGAAPLYAAELELQHQGAVSFVTGGVGEQEEAAIQSMASDYPVELLFVTKHTGEYLANVGVQVKDRNGRVVLDTTSDGPYFLAKLAPGRYTVRAEMNGNWQERNIVVQGAKKQRVVFAWDESAA